MYTMCSHLKAVCGCISCAISGYDCRQHQVPHIYNRKHTIRIVASGEILKMKWKPTESQIYCTFCQKRFAHLTDGVQSTPLPTFSHILHFWWWCSWHSTHYYLAYGRMAFHFISWNTLNTVWDLGCIQMDFCASIVCSDEIVIDFVVIMRYAIFE